MPLTKLTISPGIDKENTDTGAITYSRAFSQEKAVETIILERKNPS